MRIYLLIFIIFWILACKKKQTNFPTKEISLADVASYDTTHLCAQKLDMVDTSLLSPSKMWIVDSFLVVLDEGYKYDRHDFLRFYKAGTQELVMTFGKIGRGPGEYLSPRFFKQSEHEFLIVEKMKYAVLNVDSLKSDQNYHPIKHNVKVGLTAVSYAYKLNDSILFFNSSSPWQFSFLNVSSSERKDFNNFPSLISNPNLTDFVANTNIYSANYSFNEGETSKLCVAYHYFPVIDIVDFNNFNIVRLLFPYNERLYNIVVLDTLNAKIEGKHLYYKDIYTTTSYIYTLYHDRDNRFEIHQFLWSGVFVKRFVVNEYIYSICIDETAQKLYAIKRDDNYESVIIVYDL